MKYIEQRLKNLEKELSLLKAKFKLEETKTTGFVNKHPIRLGNKDTSHYLNNYPPYNDTNKEDYMYTDSVLYPLDPAPMTFWDGLEKFDECEKNPLDTINANLSSLSENLNVPNSDYVDSSDLPEYYPPYPNFFSSWDEKSFNDVVNENVLDDCGFKMNYEKPIATWGFASKFDKMDKEFLKNSLELKLEEKFGKIVSKFRILNHEWEMDGYGYIVNSGIDCQPVVTDHGKPVIVDKNYLETKISEYKEAIQETQRALFLIK